MIDKSPDMVTEPHNLSMDRIHRLEKFKYVASSDEALTTVEDIQGMTAPRPVAVHYPTVVPVGAEAIPYEDLVPHGCDLADLQSSTRRVHFQHDANVLLLREILGDDLNSTYAGPGEGFGLPESRPHQGGVIVLGARNMTDT